MALGTTAALSRPSDPPAAVIDARTPISFLGVGPVRVGMSLKELRSAVHALEVEPELTPGCTYATPRTSGGDLSFMLSGDVVARVDVSKRGFRTRSGARIGDSEDRIKELYRGRVEVSQHAYANGHYLTVHSEDRRYAVVFETDGKVVTSFRIGRLPEVLYIEGCA